jgi:hypothetical protein
MCRSHSDRVIWINIANHYRLTISLSDAGLFVQNFLS